MKKILLAIAIITSLASYGADTLKIGVHLTAPFAGYTKPGGAEVMSGVPDENAHWGVSKLLLNEFAKDSGYVIQYKNYATTNGVIDAIENGEVDLGAGAITVNYERYQRVNFSQPFYRSSISLAYDPDEAYSTWGAVVSFFNMDLLYGVLMLCMYLWIAGIIFWLVERKKNEQFPSIFIGAYFAFMILSTVGFGDISPRTKTGKGLVMLFGTICLIVSGFFLANIASSFTLSKLDSEITMKNLNKKKVGTLRGCTSAELLDQNNVRYIGYNNADEALDAIKSKELDVFVYDTPVLQYMINKKNYTDNVVLSDEEYDPQFYAYPIRKGSNIEKQLNPYIIQFMGSDKWENILNFYKLEQ